MIARAEAMIARAEATIARAEATIAGVMRVAVMSARKAMKETYQVLSMIVMTGTTRIQDG